MIDVLARRTEPLVLLGVVGVALGLSTINAFDPTTWWLEVMPIFIAAPILVATAKTFPLTRLAYWLIAVHALILIVGGHYTYARVPLGFWMQEALEFSRNQGDVWDTQWDILFALIGSIAAQLMLTRVHDRQLRALTAKCRSPV